MTDTTGASENQPQLTQIIIYKHGGVDLQAKCDKCGELITYSCHTYNFYSKMKVVNLCGLDDLRMCKCPTMLKIGKIYLSQLAC